ncbi:MAG TPA: Hsp20/alpha crystallin family protein [Candidatus Dormibacteraeota bacterium]
MLRSIWDELEDMNRRIDETFGVYPALPVRRFLLPTWPLASEKPFTPTTDVFAKDGDLVIHLDLPGIDPVKDVKITIEDGELVVTGERKKEEAYREADYYRVERLYGTFERHFPIPKTIDAKAVTATYTEGVLEIVLKGAVLVAEAKKEEAKAIPVEVKKPELAAKA